MTDLDVVCNSSPLIALDRIDHLFVLKDLFGTVLVPSAVRREVYGSVPPPEWIEVRVLAQPLAAQVLAARLGDGEREAIALALEINADELILDDLPARRLAIRLGLPVIGTLGILLRAKLHGLIPAVRPVLDALASADFRIAAHVRTGVLAAAGEGED